MEIIIAIATCNESIRYIYFILRFWGFKLSLNPNNKPFIELQKKKRKNKLFSLDFFFFKHVSVVLAHCPFLFYSFAILGRPYLTLDEWMQGIAAMVR